MKQFLLTLFCLLVLRLQATPIEWSEPVGQRFGLSLLEVLDSVYTEGVYHYAGSSGKPHTPDESVVVMFLDKSGEHSLDYTFTHDKCDLAMMTLPLAELDAVVQSYDRLFPSAGKQMWSTPYGRIKVSVAIGQESVRRDHKPHVSIFFDPNF